MSRQNSIDIRHDALLSMQTNGTLQDLSTQERRERAREHRTNQGLWTKLAESASPPDLPTKELIRRSTFLAMSTMTVGAGLLWSLMYVCLEEYLAACMPALYSVCMGGILITCICRPMMMHPSHGGASSSSSSAGGARAGPGGGEGGSGEGGGGGGRGYDLFVNAQLGLILLLPFAVHVALGGLEESGGVMLWSFLSPVGAAFFRSTSEGLRWFRLYMSINVVLLTWAFWDGEGGHASAGGKGGEWGGHYDGAGEHDGGSGSTGGTSDVVPRVGVVGEYPPSMTSSTSSETIRRLYWLMNIVGLKCVVFAAVYLFARELETEYAKSEEMLLNILPSSIMRRMKRGEFPIVDHVSNVTILFADLGECKNDGHTVFFFSRAMV
jgi:hypothetical protein